MAKILDFILNKTNSINLDNNKGTIIDFLIINLNLKTILKANLTWENVRFAYNKDINPSLHECSKNTINNLKKKYHDPYLYPNTGATSHMSLIYKPRNT